MYLFTDVEKLDYLKRELQTRKDRTAREVALIKDILTDYLVLADLESAAQ